MVIKISKNEFLELSKTQYFGSNIFVLYKNKENKSIELCYTLKESTDKSLVFIDIFKGSVPNFNEHKDIRHLTHISNFIRAEVPNENAYEELVSWLPPDTTYISVDDGDFSAPIWFTHNMITDGVCCFGIKKEKKL